MLTLSHPFSHAETTDQVMENIKAADFKRLNDSGEALPRTLVQIAHACLRLEPASRPGVANILSHPVLRHRAKQLAVELPPEEEPPEL